MNRNKDRCVCGHKKREHEGNKDRCQWIIYFTGNKRSPVTNEVINRSKKQCSCEEFFLRRWRG